MNQNKFIFFSLLGAFLVATIAGAVFGIIGGGLAIKYIWPQVGLETASVKVVQEESQITAAVDKASPAVVSIIISEEAGSGSGFIISNDGYIVTNQHVVADPTLEYTVLLTSGEQYTAQVLARDSLNDLAYLKIEAQNLPEVELGDSDQLKVGQTAIAIGYALGEFKNTVSVGVISGLSRQIVAGDGFSQTEELEDIIQTDAAINFGNSGGPLLNSEGQVIGVNVATAYGYENIGFAIPVNQIKNDVDSLQSQGKISRPYLGVRYQIINSVLQQLNNLSVDYGALIISGQTAAELAVIPGSPADKAGLVANDIILEINGQRITEEDTLIELIEDYQVGDKVSLKILHQGEEKTIEVTLAERPN